MNNYAYAESDQFYLHKSLLTRSSNEKLQEQVKLEDEENKAEQMRLQGQTLVYGEKIQVQLKHKVTLPSQ